MINYFQDLSELPNLEFLMLNYSNLKKFPASISKLNKLKGLSIEASNIHQLPPEISSLRELSYLNLRNNGRLKDLPLEIKYLKNLKLFRCFG